MENKTPNTKTEISTIFQRIDEKISNLYKVLEPVCVNYPTEPAKEVIEIEQTSSIIMEIKIIEDRITTLLDSIRI